MASEQINPDRRLVVRWSRLKWLLNGDEMLRLTYGVHLRSIELAVRNTHCRWRSERAAWRLDRMGKEIRGLHAIAPKMLDRDVISSVTWKVLWLSWMGRVLGLHCGMLTGETMTEKEQRLRAALSAHVNGLYAETGRIFNPTGYDPLQDWGEISIWPAVFQIPLFSSD